MSKRQREREREVSSPLAVARGTSLGLGHGVRESGYTYIFVVMQQCIITHSETALLWLSLGQREF